MKNALVAMALNGTALPISLADHQKHIGHSTEARNVYENVAMPAHEKFAASLDNGKIQDEFNGTRGYFVVSGGLLYNGRIEVCRIHLFVWAKDNHTKYGWEWKDCGFVDSMPKSDFFDSGIYGEIKE